MACKRSAVRSRIAPPISQGPTLVVGPFFSCPKKGKLMADLDRAAACLAQASRVVVFTGAGVSAESGIATFRDAQTGLWARFDPQRLATPEAFLADPELVWGWYEWRRARLAQVSPNPAHQAIAELAGQVAQLQVVTQNVDDLHERAGSRSVIHLHGSIQQPRCFDCARPMAIPVAEVMRMASVWLRPVARCVTAWPVRGWCGSVKACRSRPGRLPGRRCRPATCCSRWVPPAPSIPLPGCPGARWSRAPGSSMSIPSQ